MRSAQRVDTVQIPYAPRPLQAAVGRTMRTKRFGCLVCHRRFGKTVLAVNMLQQGALMCSKPRPRFGYIAPTYRQGKAVAFDYMQHYARPIPGVSINQSELRIDYPNGGQVRIYGGDNPDSLRGLYFDGVVMDEYGLHPPQVYTEVIGPALSDRGGWALFIGTPAGKNQFYDVAQKAQVEVAAGNPLWHFAEHKASQTGYVSESELAIARSNMTADEYAQEYECSFEASVKGAIYAAEIGSARDSGRVTVVPYDPVLPVDTDWDLGVGDHTGIWFSQSLRGGEVRLIDYYEASGEGLPHYVGILKAKGYTYGTHWAPHDIQVKEFASGRSRLEAAASLGIRFQVAPNVPLEDGIHAARMLLPRCYFDAGKCKAGLEALQHYRRDWNSRLNEFKAVPVHDWASHGADAFRYLAVRQKVATDTAKPPAPYRPSTVWN
jgi:phage terminase large subunit